MCCRGLAPDTSTLPPPCTSPMKVECLLNFADVVACVLAKNDVTPACIFCCVSMNVCADTCMIRHIHFYCQISMFACVQHAAHAS